MGPTLARRIPDHDRLLDAYAAAAASMMPETALTVGVTWREPATALAETGQRWNETGVSWAATSTVAASVFAPYLTTVTTAEVYVDRKTIAGLEEVAAKAGLQPIEGRASHPSSIPHGYSQTACRGKARTKPRSVAPRIRRPARRRRARRGSGRASPGRDPWPMIRLPAPGSHVKRPSGRLYASSTTTGHDQSSSCSEAWFRNLLCAGSEFHHAGTTDVDVQVDLEIAYGAVNAARLEQALRNAEFEPEDDRVWRWVADGAVAGTVVKFELLADLHDQRTGARISFDACENLGAVNLHGTGFASRDIQVRDLSARIGGVTYNTQVNVAGLAGFLLAKTAAAYSRRAPKDWYDMAFVLLHNDAGGQRPRPCRCGTGLLTTSARSRRRLTICEQISRVPLRRVPGPILPKCGSITPSLIPRASPLKPQSRCRNSIGACGLPPVRGKPAKSGEEAVYVLAVTHSTRDRLRL